MMVAASFRKEVTATVMWLLDHGLPVQCFKVTPYSLDEDLILDIRQIIPAPEAEEFMMGMARKAKSEATAKGGKSRKEGLQINFWTQTLEALRKAGIKQYANISPQGQHWLSCRTGVPDTEFNLIFVNKEVRVEFVFTSALKEQNKAFFDAVHDGKFRIEEKFGEKLTWWCNDEAKQSKIYCAKPFDSMNKDNWLEMIEWLVTHFTRLESAIIGEVKRAAQSLENRDVTD